MMPSMVHLAKTTMLLGRLLCSRLLDSQKCGANLLTLGRAPAFALKFGDGLSSAATATPHRSEGKEGGHDGKRPDLLAEWGATQEGDGWKFHEPLLMICRPVSREALGKRLDWLVQELDCQQKDVVKILEKCPAFMDVSLEEEVAPFLQMFMNEGALHKGMVRRMVLRHPPVIGCSKGFEAAMTFLKEALGTSRKEWLKAVSNYPYVLKHDIPVTGKRIVGELLEYGFTVEDIAPMVLKYPPFLGMSVADDFEPQVEVLLSIGLTKEVIIPVLSKAPHLIDKRHGTAIVNKMKWLSSELEIESSKAIEFIARHPKLFGIGLENWKKVYAFFIAEGMSKEDFRSCFMKCPFFLAWPLASLQEKYNFACKVLKKTVADIAQFPDYFRYSLEDRIMLRTAVLDSMEKDFTKPKLHALLSPSKATFEARYGKKYPPDTIKSFEARWIALDSDEKRQMMKDKTYWEQPKQAQP